eukprot:GHVL01042067.1.p1 GENE.GHVL01042067.1~~GHVL01042067.1.p1  ORF type:complete len:223 (+),score=39.35 GHVL01042067.1:95-670(+)
MAVLLVILFQNPVISKILLLLVRKYDYKSFFINLIRAFPPGVDPLLKYRERPNGPLLETLNWRFCNWNENSFKKELNRIKEFTDRIINGGIKVPGMLADKVTFWLYPIFCPQGITQIDAIKKLSKYGIEAFTGASQLNAVSAETGYQRATEAEELMKTIIYLPVHRKVTQSDLQKLSSRLVICLKQDKCNM